MPEATPQTRGPAARLLRDWLGFEFVSRIYLYSVLIGLISGLGAVLFTYGLALAKFLLVEKLAGYRQLHPRKEALFDFSFLDAPTYGEFLWLLLLLPALGGLLSGYLTHRFAPEAQGAGYRRHDRRLPQPARAHPPYCRPSQGPGDHHHARLRWCRRSARSFGAYWRGFRLLDRRQTQALGCPAADFVAGGHGRRARRNFPCAPRCCDRQRGSALPRRL